MQTETAHTPAKARLLIVDDEPGIREILRKILARLPEPPPVEIETAESAEAALALLDRSTFALILTDFNMGGKDGIYLLATALERWPNTRRVLMTGYNDESIAIQARERGQAAAIVRKPWTNAHLTALVRSLLLAPAPPVLVRGESG